MSESPPNRSEHDYSAGSDVGEDRPPRTATDTGVPPVRREIWGYLLGFALAVVLTIASFWASRTDLIYGPSLAVAFLVVAVAQMGVHLIFFLHITTDPDNTNNVMALAFGVLIVCLVVFGSIWVMTHLNQNMTSPTMRMQS